MDLDQVDVDQIDINSRLGHFDILSDLNYQPVLSENSKLQQWLDLYYLTIFIFLYGASILSFLGVDGFVARAFVGMCLSVDTKKPHK